MSKCGVTMLVLFLLSLSCTAGVEVGRASGDFWLSKAPMQQARGYLGGAVVNNKIYTIGGYLGGATTIQALMKSMIQNRTHGFTRRRCQLLGAILAQRFIKTRYTA